MDKEWLQIGLVTGFRALGFRDRVRFRALWLGLRIRIRVQTSVCIMNIAPAQFYGLRCPFPPKVAITRCCRRRGHLTYGGCAYVCVDFTR